MAPPQLTILTLPFLSPVNHVPSGSAANPGAIEISPSAIADAATNALVQRFFIDGLPVPCSSQGKRIAYETVIASFFAARNFRRCPPVTPQNRRFRIGVLNANLLPAQAQRAVGSALIHRVT